MCRCSFNVLHEPWIPVVRMNGSPCELGILPCLQQSHELREIRDPAPVIEFGLYRLLVAFVLDALVLAGRRPTHWQELRELRDSGNFNMTLLNSYAERCGDVFDLFHPDRPFLQHRPNTENMKSIFDFFPVFPSGANIIHFAHQTSEKQSVTPPQAARLLTMVAPFNVKVKTGQPKTVVGDPPVYALPMGSSLFETIILNLPLPNQRFTEQEERQAGPVWRSFPTDSQPGTTPAQSFTWPCRYILLSPPGNQGYVTQIINGKGLRGPGTWRDPSCAVFEGDGRIRHLRYDASRPLWVDAGPLSFCSNETSRPGRRRDWAFVRPDVVSNALQLIPDEAELRVRFYAWRTDEAKVYEWIRCQWSVPRNLGLSSRLGAVVQCELERADGAANALRTSIKALYPRGGAENDKALKTIADRCERAYWQRLESEFHPLMSAFAALDENAPNDPGLIADTARHWREAIGRLAFEQFELAAKDMDTDSDALKRQVDARAQLEGRLRRLRCLIRRCLR